MNTRQVGLFPPTSCKLAGYRLGSKSAQTLEPPPMLRISKRAKVILAMLGRAESLLC